MQIESKKLESCQKWDLIYPDYFHRMVSAAFTSLFLKLRWKPEQVLIFWGLLSVSSSYFIYLAIIGQPFAIAVTFTLYYVAKVLDHVDGNLARYLDRMNPVAGKILDGIFHRLTEYSILIAFTFGTFEKTGQALVIPLGFALLLGEAMQTYCFERRLLVIRLHAKPNSDPVESKRWDVRTEGWTAFSLKEKIKAFEGLLAYKTVYFMIALSYISNQLLIAGLVLLTIYKHFSWLKLITRLCLHPPELRVRQEPDAATS